MLTYSAPNDQTVHIQTHGGCQATPPHAHPVQRPRFARLYMFNNSSRCGAASLLPALLCVIVCCNAEPWCPGQSLSAFSCSEGNQLWQSCKLFLLGAKGGLEHMLAPVRRASIRAQSVPVGPLSVRLERPPRNINGTELRKEVVRLFGCAREE